MVAFFAAPPLLMSQQPAPSAPALLEQWRSANGGTGTSLNFFDPNTSHGHQYWSPATVHDSAWTAGWKAG